MIGKRSKYMFFGISIEKGSRHHTFVKVKCAFEFLIQAKQSMAYV